MLTRNFIALQKAANTTKPVTTLNNMAMELRKICNHPWLITRVYDDVDDDYKGYVYMHVCIQAHVRICLLVDCIGACTSMRVYT